MIVWINRALALAIHDRQLAEHGGGTGVRAEGMLESALARREQRHAYGDPPPDLAELSASVGVWACPHHPFVDGNKRTAAWRAKFSSCSTDAVLDADDHALYPLFVGLARARWTKQVLPTGCARGSGREPKACVQKRRRLTRVELP